MLAFCALSRPCPRGRNVVGVGRKGDAVAPASSVPSAVMPEAESVGVAGTGTDQLADGSSPATPATTWWESVIPSAHDESRRPGREESAYSCARNDGRVRIGRVGVVQKFLARSE